MSKTEETNVTKLADTKPVDTKKPEAKSTTKSAEAKKSDAKDLKKEPSTTSKSTDSQSDAKLADAAKPKDDAKSEISKTSDLLNPAKPDKIMTPMDILNSEGPKIMILNKTVDVYASASRLHPIFQINGALFLTGERATNPTTKEVFFKIRVKVGPNMEQTGYVFAGQFVGGIITNN